MEMTEYIKKNKRISNSTSMWPNRKDAIAVGKCENILEVIKLKKVFLKKHSKKFPNIRNKKSHSLVSISIN
jgi:hypothetical protein